MGLSKRTGRPPARRSGPFPLNRASCRQANQPIDPTRFFEKRRLRYWVQSISLKCLILLEPNRYAPAVNWRDQGVPLPGNVAKTTGAIVRPKADLGFWGDNTRRRKYRLSPPTSWPGLIPVMAGLDPAIGYPHQIANYAIPVSNHPMQMVGSNPAITCLRAVRQQLGPLV